MKPRVGERFILILAMFILIAAGVVECDSASSRQGIFSWKEEDVREYEPFFETIKWAGMTEIYQYFSDELSDEEILRFLQYASDQNVAVYALTGDPSWAMDRKIKQIRNALARIQKLNASLKQEEQIRGMLLDIEPYLHERWDKDPDQVMERYVEAMENACEVIDDAELESYLCIPYFYDNLEYSEELEQLIQTKCTGIAVMNYMKKNEADQIATEVSLARQLEKDVIQIYEMQKPGQQDLKEINTYYQEGLEGVEESWNTLQTKLDYSQLSFAVHDYTALNEIKEHMEEGREDE